MAVTLAERFMLRSTIDADGCFIWGGHIAKNGYGHSGNGLVHKQVWEELHGPVPNGYEIDHVCHSNDLSCAGGFTCKHRSCWNPEHLEQVTCTENRRRGRKPVMTKPNWQSLKTDCPQGHEYNEKNTHVSSDGRRKCRVCDRERRRKVV